jgi:hypothetical protein
MLLLIEQYSQMKGLMKQSTEMIHPCAVQFYIQDRDGVTDFLFLKETAAEHYVLLQEVTELAPVYKVIYEKSYFDIAMGSGFTESDFEISTGKAICGMKTEDVLNINPYKYRMKEYTAEGMIRDNNDFFSQYGFFFAEGQLHANRNQEKYIIDGRSDSEIKQIYQEIKKQAEKQGMEVVTTDSVGVKLEDSYQMRNEIFEITFLFFLSISVTLILLCQFWMSQYKEELKIRYLLGNSRLYMIIMKNYSVLLISAYCFSAVILSVRGKGYVELNQLIEYGVWLYLFCAVILTIFAIPFYKEVKKCA